MFNRPLLHPHLSRLQVKPTCGDIFDLSSVHAENYLPMELFVLIFLLFYPKKHERDANEGIYVFAPIYMHILSM